MARAYYIQNKNNPKDPPPTGAFYQLDMDGLPPNIQIWKAYDNEESTAQQQGMNSAAFKGWLNENRTISSK